MAEQDLISEYLMRMRALIGFRRDVDAIVAELEDHLRSDVERRRRGGLGELLAQRQSLDTLGEVAAVSRALCRSDGSGVALPSRLSRTGGVAAFAALALTVVSLLPLSIRVHLELVGSSDPTAYWVYAAVLLAANVAGLFALAGTLARGGGGSSAGSVAALGVASGGVLLTAVFTWGSVVTMVLVWLPFCFALVRLGRIIRVPAGAWALAAAWPAALTLSVVLNTVIGLGPTDPYGGHPWSWFAAGTLSAVLWAAGLLPLGRLLWAETAWDSPAPTVAS